MCLINLMAREPFLSSGTSRILASQHSKQEHFGLATSAIGLATANTLTQE
uniref:Uncharacterized protein n=2 Tax=Anguilla anguilla TaxID=7936 RepID=A0A0E9TLC0_ANGAN